MRAFLAIILGAALAVSGCGVRIGRMNDSQRAERLATERGKLPTLTNPVAITKSYIVISTILLDFVSGAARDGDMGAMKSLLDQYVESIRGARNAIVNSDRDPVRKPGGFKDLEIALRGHTRLLQDINKSLGVDDRQPLEAALEVTASVRDEMIQLLFPQPASAGAVGFSS